MFYFYFLSKVVKNVPSPVRLFFRILDDMSTIKNLPLFYMCLNLKLRYVGFLLEKLLSTRKAKITQLDRLSILQNPFVIDKDLGYEKEKNLSLIHI